MLEFLLEILHGSVEYKEWGWNSTTVGSVGVFIFIFVEGWGLWKQSGTIWLEKSGTSVSFRWFTFIGAYFGATIPYGIYHESIAMTASAVVTTVLHIPIIVGLMKYKDLDISEIIQSVLYLLMIPVIILTEEKEFFYTLFSFGTIYALATQPLELYKTKDPGAVDIRLIAVYVVSTLFWIVFAFSIKSPALMIVCPCSLIILLTTGVMWRYYKKRPHLSQI